MMMMIIIIIIINVKKHITLKRTRGAICVKCNA